MTITVERPTRRAAGRDVGAQDAAGRDFWTLALPTGAADPLRMSVRVEDDWLLLDAPLPASAARDPHTLLRLNATLPGPGKFCLGGQGEARLRAEMPLAEAEGVESCLCGLLPGLQWACRGAFGDGGAEVCAPDEPNEDRRPEVVRLCREAGWPLAEREDGRCLLELEAGHGYWQATVEAVGSEMRASVALASWERLEPPCTGAITRFLLSAGGVLRLARAAVTDEGERETALLQAHLPFAPDSSLLVHALASLSVGVHIAGREITALMNPDVAGRFLAQF